MSIQTGYFPTARMRRIALEYIQTHLDTRAVHVNRNCSETPFGIQLPGNNMVPDLKAWANTFAAGYEAGLKEDN